MKTRMFLCAAAMFLTTSSPAQQYSIDWHTIDGGGGASSGGGFTVSGTIGQPDAGGPMTGAPYLLTGGFWALPLAEQSFDRPALTIVPFGPGQARISWSPASSGFVLQETLSLQPANWFNSPSGVANPVTVPVLQPTKFYRLRKP
jgi:hypothetical protein